MKTKFHYPFFVVRFKVNGMWYQFDGGTIDRSKTDGCGNPIYTADVHDENGRPGVVNLTPDWKIKSIFME